MYCIDLLPSVVVGITLVAESRNSSSPHPNQTGGLVVDLESDFFGETKIEKVLQ